MSAATVEIANRALAALSGRELQVIRLAYGFEEFDPVPDAEIAHRIGTNRTTAWRIRLRALDRMRSALAEHDDLDHLACLAYGIRVRDEQDA